jgi:hypothetical protein
MPRLTCIFCLSTNLVIFNDKQGLRLSSHAVDLSSRHDHTIYAASELLQARTTYFEWLGATTYSAEDCDSATLLLRKRQAVRLF